MDMRIGGEQLEVHPFSHDKKEQHKHRFLRDKVLSDWRVIHCLKNPEKPVSYQTDGESAGTIRSASMKSNIYLHPKSIHNL